MKQFFTRAILAATLAMVPTLSDASSITFTGTNGSNLAASATFSNDLPGFLTVTLTNTSLSDANVPVDVLTAVFFNLNAGAALSAAGSSAILAPGSSVVYDTDGPVTTNVGGEWAVQTGVNNTYSANFGISSSGLDVFDKANLNGPNLANPANGALDGLQYGILPAGYVPLGDNPKIPGSEGLIKNSVVFTIASTGPLTGVGNVTFQYGTALSEGHLTGSGGPNITQFAAVPDGGTTLSLLGLSMVGLAYTRRKFSI